MTNEDKALEYAINETRKMMVADGVPVEEQDRIIASCRKEAVAMESGEGSPAERASVAMLDTSRGNISWGNLNRIDLQEAYVLFASIVTAIKTLSKVGKGDDDELTLKVILGLVSQTIDNMQAGEKA